MKYTLGIMMNIFKNAETIPTESKKKKESMPVVDINGIEIISAINSVIGYLNKIKADQENKTKDEILNCFVESVTASKARPKSFEGIDGDVSATCMFKMKPKNSAISGDDAKVLKKYRVGTTTVDKGVTTYLINPKYATNEKLLEKISKTLLDNPFLPQDLFLKQEPSTSIIIDQENVDAVWKKSKSALTALLPVIGTIAIKTTKGTDDPDQRAFERVSQLLAGE